jgi:hypothetical protein
LSGNSRDLTFYNAGGTTYSANPAGPPVYQTSTLGNFSLDGVNDWGKFSQFTFPSAVTVTVWIRTTFNTAGSRKGLISHCSGGPVGLTYSMRDGKMLYQYYSAQWRESVGNGTINDGNWKNLVWAKSGTNMKTYINNVLDKEETLIANVTGLMNCIGSEWGPCNSDSYGAGTDSYGTVWSGNIAMVMVHNKQLSVAEIAQNYNNTRRRFGL